MYDTQIINNGWGGMRAGYWNEVPAEIYATGVTVTDSGGYGVRATNNSNIYIVDSEIGRNNGRELLFDYGEGGFGEVFVDGEACPYGAGPNSNRTFGDIPWKGGHANCSDRVK